MFQNLSRALLLSLFLLTSPAFAQVKLSQINNGGAINTSTDQCVAVRSGTTDELVTLAASAGIDTTNASNISSGSLSCSLLPPLTGDVTTSSCSSTVGSIGGNAISLGGAFTMSGPFTFTGTVTGNTSVTFPTSGTLSTSTGTVTSVTFTGDGIVDSSTPSTAVTTTGTVTATAISQTKNTVLSGPAAGANANPSFRALVGADLPNPSATTLGGVESITAVTHDFLTSISTAGVPAQAQPACADISNAGTTCTQNTGTSGANVPLLNANNTASGSNVQSGSYAITGTTTPTQATGTLGLAGTATKPTLGASAEGDIFLTSVGGLSLIGQGGTNDFSLFNKGGTQICAIATGTTNLNCNGLQVSGAAVLTANQTITLSGDTTGSGTTAITTTTGKVNGVSYNASPSTNTVPVVTGANATTYETVPIAAGGTGQITANAAFNALSPMTTGGDIIYGGASGVATRLANGSAGQVLQSQGTTLAPIWATPSGGAGGGGMFNYSDNGVTVTANTYFIPPGGGGIPQTTEANVSVASPSATTAANLRISVSAAPGAGNSYTFTLRDGGADTALTCAISGASATTCSDTTHSVNIASGDVIDWKLVSAGTIITSPTITIAANNGTSSVGVTSVATGNILQGGAITTTGTINLDDPSRCDCRITLASGQPKYNPVPATPVSEASNILTFTNPHGWTTGTVVVPLTTAGGATHDVAYYVNAESATTIELFTTLAGAITNTTPLTLSAITGLLQPAGIQFKTLYLDPSNLGGVISLYDGSAHWNSYLLTEQSLAISALTNGKNYDVFVFDSSGTPTLELSAAWTSDTLRADALALQNGVLVKSADHKRRWLGTVRTIATDTLADVWYGNGTVTPQLYVSNAYNKILRHAYTSPAYSNDNATTTYTTASTTWVAANGGTGSKIEFLSDQINSVDIYENMNAANSSTNANRHGLGIDITTDAVCAASIASTTAVTMPCRYENQLSEGYHAANLIISVAAGTGTYNADARLAGASYDVPLSFMDAKIWE